MVIIQHQFSNQMKYKDLHYLCCLKKIYEIFIDNDLFMIFFSLQSHVNQEKYSQMCVQSLQLGIKFLLNTYFRTKKKLRSVQSFVSELFLSIICNNSSETFEFVSIFYLRFKTRKALYISGLEDIC